MSSILVFGSTVASVNFLGPVKPLSITSKGVKLNGTLKLLLLLAKRCIQYRGVNEQQSLGAGLVI